MGGIFSSRSRQNRENRGDRRGSDDNEDNVDGEGSENRGEGGDNEDREDKVLQQLFVKQLKAKYKQLYDAVQPIPYIRDRLFCVDRVFVEGGIEYLDQSWLPLDSYHSVFSFRRVKGKRRIVIGEPGYGKSTLTLQYAYDWCNKTRTSPLKNVKILILLRLRQLGGIQSIYKAIKQFTLPRYSQLNESDIQAILNKCTSVVVILDGFDEYPDAEKSTVSDIKQIITSEMFGQFEVILTTRYLPKHGIIGTKRLRLIGFDDRARDKYIRKAVVSGNVKAAKRMKQRLQENPILGDLCQVPLFFVMFAHMGHEDKDFQTLKTVTNLFQYMIECLHSYIRNKMDDVNIHRYHMYESDHRKLDKVAFEGLSKQNPQIVWGKKYLIFILGKEFYDQYIRLGILVEEEDLNDVDNSSSYQQQREVRFCHKVFCEWYAAHHLAAYAAMKPNKLEEALRYMDPLDLQYCYRFACGLNHKAAGSIIKYVKQRDRGDKFAVLCILEQDNEVEDILDSVRSLCSKEIVLEEGDNKLLQRSTVQLLEIASSHKISISHVWLEKCYSSVDLSGANHLQLKSILCIPVLTTLNKLTIDLRNEGRKITAEEFTGILQYSSKCLALKELRFLWCLLPQYVQAECVSVLRKRNVKVIWVVGDIASDPDYKLNLKSCHWERLDDHGNVVVMTDDEYQKEVETLRKEQIRLRVKQRRLRGDYN